jgi:aspartate/methionine/tyrosine aminotransferase
MLPDPTSRYPRAISMGTLSKAYGLPGLRVGWLIAPPEVLEQCVRIRDYVSLHLSPLIELLAERAIRHGDAIVQDRRERALANLMHCSRWAAENAGRIEWIPPQGGVCAFPRLPQVRDVDRFCRVLADRDRVLTVPGSCFGFPQHIRLGFGGSRHELEGGLTRLAKALADPNFAEL